MHLWSNKNIKGWEKDNDEEKNKSHNGYVKLQHQMSEIQIYKTKTKQTNCNSYRKTITSGIINWKDATHKILDKNNSYSVVLYFGLIIFADTKRVFIICNSKKNRQCNSQKSKLRSTKYYTENKKLSTTNTL